MFFPTLLHSISYTGGWGQAALSLEAFVDRAAELGYDGVMLAGKRPHLSPLDYGERERAKLRARLERHELGYVCVAAYNNFTSDWSYADIPRHEVWVQYLVEMARLTRDVGGRVLRIFTGYEHPGGAFGAQWSAVVNAVKELSRRAAEYDVTIGVQNHHDIGVGWEAHQELIAAVEEPNCRAAFDAWAPVLHGADATAAARQMGALAVHTTTANYQRLPRYRYEQGGLANYTPQVPHMQAVPIDEGVIDYRGFLTALREGGFEGTVAYEMCSPLRGGGSLENLDRYARRFIALIHQLRADIADEQAVGAAGGRRGPQR
jgi:sugar phosphate isomerase/epimerase